MASPLIYYAYTPDTRKWERGPSLRAVDALRAAGYQVDAHPCRGDKDYSLGLRAAWTHPGDLIILEHDMAPTVAQMDELVACPHPLCAFAYWIVLAQVGHRPMLSACVGPMGTLIGNQLNPRILYGTNHAGYSAIGCCKLDQATRSQMAEIPPCYWSEVEMYVNRAVQVAGEWHIHYPVVNHHHGFMEDAYGTAAS